MERHPPKRARQACEPCRRKKSRCPGERPACSYCVRLRQQCVYKSSVDVQIVHDRDMVAKSRMDNLEGKLDMLLHRIIPDMTEARPSAQPRLSGSPRSHMSVDDSTSATVVNQQRENSPSDAPMPEPSLECLGQLYLTWCHNQPLALFSKDTFVESIPKRDRELILALQALAFRFPPGSLTPQRNEQLASMAKEARQIVMNRITEGHVKLSTLQTQCLLSLVHFTDGRTTQAGLDLNIACHLAQTLLQSNQVDDSAEWHDCIGSIMLLNYLQGSIFPSATLVGNPIPISSWYGLDPIARQKNHPDAQYSKGILGFTIPLAQAWQMARTYAASRVVHDVLPPWDPQSDYSRVMQRHLEIDCSVPLKYRFAANSFGDEDATTRQQRRDYWGPWFYTQFIYTAIPCLLNHPFLLSLRLRNFRSTIPQAFIQQSFEAISRHAMWIIYYLDLLERMSFQLTDPALAHCVVIIATIHLQHSFVQDPSLRHKAERGFEKCMKFLCRMASVWPSVSAMCQNLRTLQHSIHVIPSPDASPGKRSFSINGQLLWDILTYDRAGRPNGHADQSMFDNNLLVRNPEYQDTDHGSAAEFDLVGSAGISGHKAVSAETPLYPPDEDGAGPSSTIRESFGNILGTGSNMADLGIPADFSWLNEQEGSFLQANDFGQAIDDWLNFDLNQSSM